MTRGISPVGVLVGGIVNVGASLAVFSLSLLVRALRMGAGAAGLSDAERERLVRAAYEAVTTERTATAAVVAWLLGALCGVAAGYVAARVAGRGHVTNGALATAVAVGVALASLATQSDGAIHARDLATLLVAPLFGASGGYLRLREVEADESAPAAWRFE